VTNRDMNRDKCFFACGRNLAGSSGCGKVGIHDNFFDLDGPSLKLVELHKKLGDKIDTPLTLVYLFAHPTVSALVEHITKPQTPTGARSGEVDRVANMAAGNKRLKQLRQSRKRNTGIKG
jgi:hypothetical protein